MRGHMAQATVYSCEPARVAKEFEAEGAQLIHVLIWMVRPRASRDLERYSPDLRGSELRDPGERGAEDY